MNQTATRPDYQTIRVETDADGITWVTFNRPEKRNAMNPQLHYDMEDALMRLETDDATRVIVITGAGEAWSAGMDLKEFFRATDKDPTAQFRSYTANKHWAWEMLTTSRKPSIAMVNGYCLGGAWTSLCCCDIVIAADEATFGLPEVNWGIIPAGLVAKVMTDLMPFRQAMFYAMTGRTFGGKTAVEVGLATVSVPQARLREETVKLARELIAKSPTVLAFTKQAMRTVRNMDAPQAFDYLAAKLLALRFVDPARTRDKGITEFIENKSFKPTYEPVKGGG